jgi:hypothetical protein
MADAPYTKAPRWRGALAGLLDAALVGGFVWMRARGEGPAQAAANMRWLRFVPADAVREQVGTPGQRLLGIRTVDRRTGERVALWRTAALVGTALAAQRLAQQLAPPRPSAEQEAQRRAYGAEVRSVYERHPQASPQREAELRELAARYPSMQSTNALRAVGPALAAGVLSNRLRRRLAPTVEVLARRRRDHSP